MSVKLAPGVSRRSVAVAISCGVISVIPNTFAWRMISSENRSPLFGIMRRQALPLAHHVLLEIDDDLDQPAPGIFDRHAGAFEVFAQFSRVLALVGARRRQVGRRPWRRRAQRRDLRLQAGDLVLQARDLFVERGAVFRYRLERPADRVRAAE